MEESKGRALLRPTKLDLAAPLLSTRRSQTNSRTTLSNNPTNSDMVPFSWERIPGEPKEKEGTNGNYDIAPLPPPKPPPGRAQPPPAETNKLTNQACEDDDGLGHESDHRKEEQFLDTIDFFSLAEESTCEEEEEEDEYERLSKEKRDSDTFLEYEEYPSPSFIIQRFLPDAQALAEASVMRMKGRPHPINSSPRAVGVRRSHEVPKGCGLGGFFGWRVPRPKPCSMKSPVRDAIVGLNHKQN